MFIGFIAVIVILLIIVGFMATGGVSGSDNSTYITEAKKAQALISNLGSETSYYYIGNETFNDLDMNYFVSHNFAPNLVVTDNPGMAKDDWDGWPDSIDSSKGLDADGDNELDDNYSGPYIKLGGSAGTQIRLIVGPVNGGNNAGIFILKKKDNTLDPNFVKILENTLSTDPTYIGG